MLTEKQIAEWDLQPKIRAVLEKTYPDIKIKAENIILKPDEDFDGDPIVRIYITYKGGDLNKDSDRAAALDHIRDILLEQGDSSFPILNFIKEKAPRKGKQAA